MPRTRREIVAAFLGLALVAGLLAWDVRHRHQRKDVAVAAVAAPTTTAAAPTTTAAAPTTTAAAPTTTAAAPTPTTTAAPPPTTTTATAATARAAVPRRTPRRGRPGRRPAAARRQLVLVGKRTGCWVSARAGSPTGKSLYEGKVANGQRVRLPLVRGGIWLRLGAAGNLRAVLDGKPVTSFPNGTVDLLVTAHGIARAA